MGLQLEIFKYSDGDHLDNVRTVEIDSEIWFVAIDITTVLGYSNSSKAIADHCKPKGVTKRYPLMTFWGIFQNCYHEKIVIKILGIYRDKYYLSSIIKSYAF